MTSKHNGFSLLDSLIALVVLSVGVIGLVKLQIYIDRRADFALNSIEALHLAEDKLEFFRASSVNSAGTGTIWFDGPQFNSDDDTASVSGSSYTFNRKWVIEDKLSLSGVAGAKLIHVTVDWVDRWNNTSKVELETMVSRYSEFD